MSEQNMKSSQIRSRVLAIELLVDTPVVFAVVVYIQSILSPSASEWNSLAVIVGATIMVWRKNK